MGIAVSGYFDKKVTVEIEITALQDAAWLARVERSNRQTGVARHSSISDRSLEEIIAVCTAAFSGSLRTNPMPDGRSATHDR